MNAEDFAKSIIESHFPLYKDNSELTKSLAQIFRTLYQLGKSSGENELRNRVSPILGSPTLSNEDTKQLASILSQLTQ